MSVHLPLRQRRVEVCARAPPAPLSAGQAVRSRTPVRRWRSGRWTLIDGRRLLYYRPRPYIALVLALPALVGASVAGAIWSATMMVPAFVVLVACLWVFQYFFLQ